MSPPATGTTHTTSIVLPPGSAATDTGRHTAPPGIVELPVEGVASFHPRPSAREQYEALGGRSSVLRRDPGLMGTALWEDESDGRRGSSIHLMRSLGALRPVGAGTGRVGWVD